jgi:hypothetical protein
MMYEGVDPFWGIIFMINLLAAKSYTLVNHKKAHQTNDQISEMFKSPIRIISPNGQF